MDSFEMIQELLSEYKKDTDAEIYALQRRVYELQSRIYQMEIEKYFETKCKNEKQ